MIFPDHYRVATLEEQKELEVCDDYEVLLGPYGFWCILTEPEDRSFYRDIGGLVYELNRLNSLLKAEINKEDADGNA